MLNIAVFMGELQLDSQRKVLEGISSEAVRNGDNVFLYALTLILDDEFNKGECEIVLSADLNMYDGFIIYAESIYSSEVREKLIKKILSLGKPCASIDCVIPGTINVSSDNEGAMRALSRHMIDKHDIRVVNFIGGPLDSFDAITRKSVFVQEMRNAGYDVSAERIYTGDYYARSGRQAVAYFE